MSEHYNSMISVIQNSLEKTSGFVEVPLDDVEIVLCYRKFNEMIDDPECDEVFQALAPGVFRRFTIQTGKDIRFTWMRVSSLDDLSSSLKRDFEGFTDQQLDAIKVSIIFQKMKSDEAKENSERRLSM